MLLSTFSSQISASKYQGISDDALKDEDNAAWVTILEPEVRAAWIERIRWIRLVDRLAEEELLDSSCSRFQQFRLNWERLQNREVILPNVAHQDVLLRMQVCWFDDSVHQHQDFTVRAWNRYLEAIAKYHGSNLVLDTLRDYERMAAHLSGSFFQVFPYLPLKYHRAAACLGMVDQFFNNLRDLQEDAKQRLCYFPEKLLSHFGLQRENILEMNCCNNNRYQKLMQFWLNDYLPKLSQNLSHLIAAEDLHPSWKLCRDWCLHRYQRIERIFRQCNFDYKAFPDLYWSQVRAELPELIAAAKQGNFC